MNEQNVQLDDVDRRIIEVLRGDGRMSVSALAQQVNVARATAYQRLNRMTDAGVIRRFTIDVDPKRVGLPIAALVMIQVDQHAWREIADKLRRLPGVDWLAFSTGSFDFVALVRAADVDHLRDVVLRGFQALPEIRSTQTLFLLDEPEPAPASPPGEGP